jgi:uncharacterized protein (TIGR02271 family)
MKMTEHPIVVGIFRDRELEARAIDELRRAGIRDEDISVMGHATPAGGLLDRLVSKLMESETERRTWYDQLVSKGMSQDEAHYYQQEVEAGRFVVIVEASNRQQEARDILHRYGAYDAHTRVEQIETERTVPVREEVFQVDKQLVETGEVVLRKEVITEEKTITVPVTREELIIERRPPSPRSSDQPVLESKVLDELLKVGGPIKIVLYEEQVSIEKHPVVKEEILIGKRQIQETRHISDTLKREEVHIERIGNVHIQEKYGSMTSENPAS